MTVQELTAKLPAQYQPWVAQYGPLLVTWTEQQVTDFLNLLKAGNVYDAELNLMSAMDETSRLAEWDSILEAFKTADQTQFDTLTLAKQAFTAFLQVTIGLGLAAVGL